MPRFWPFLRKVLPRAVSGPDHHRSRSRSGTRKIRAFQARAEASSNVTVARSSAEARAVSVSAAIIFELWADEAATDTWCAGKVTPSPAGGRDPTARERWQGHSAKASRLSPPRVEVSGKQRSGCVIATHARLIHTPLAVRSL